MPANQIAQHPGVPVGAALRLIRGGQAAPTDAEPCRADRRPTLAQITRHDTGVGPTGPGRWWAWDGDRIVGLTALFVPAGGVLADLEGFPATPVQYLTGMLVWRWDTVPDAIDGYWTRGWLCAPATAPAWLEASPSPDEERTE